MGAHRQWKVPRRGPQAARDATLALRLCALTLRPPRQRQREGLPVVTLWAVPGQEVEPPADVTPIEWRVVTTVAVDTVDDATQGMQWYSCRWGSEVWHRILTSGWRIEARQRASGERWQRCLTLSRVIAWRIFSATMLARAVPDRPCSVLLDLDEWPALSWAIQQCPTPPEEPPSLVPAVHWLAQRGGFVGRRRRAQPGTATLWRGFQH